MEGSAERPDRRGMSIPMMQKMEFLRADYLEQGTGDNFYKQGQLLPENFEAAAKENGIDGLTLRYQEVS